MFPYEKPQRFNTLKTWLYSDNGSLVTEQDHKLKAYGIRNYSYLFLLDNNCMEMTGWWIDTLYTVLLISEALPSGQPVCGGEKWHWTVAVLEYYKERQLYWECSSLQDRQQWLEGMKFVLWNKTLNGHIWNAWTLYINFIWPLMA